MAFEATVEGLAGLRVQAVDYWDVHNYGSEPARWDYGDWHHAPMGVQLSTDEGPRVITWTNTFHPYGVEVFDDPIERHLILGEDGPERVGPVGASRWQPVLGRPIERAVAMWGTVESGPGVDQRGRVVGLPRTVEVPVGLRLDFDSAAVWFVAAVPKWPSMEGVRYFGDEIMVVFSADKMRAIGWTDPLGEP
ncbi:hypothetical protein [Nocardia carnea]|uniref:hypothetical protein n=1 Tax=Nocardia carnea TaxID=37328 RepID=UPI00245762EB|nr:hypothetical protein [Nocardia carnea]